MMFYRALYAASGASYETTFSTQHDASETISNTYIIADNNTRHNPAGELRSHKKATQQRDTCTHARANFSTLSWCSLAFGPIIVYSSAVAEVA